MRLEALAVPRGENVRVVNGAYEFDLVCRRAYAARPVVWACPAGTTWRTPSRPAPWPCAGCRPSSCVKAWLQLPWCVAVASRPGSLGPDVVFIDDYAHHPEGTGCLHRQCARDVSRQTHHRHLPAAPLHPHSRPRGRGFGRSLAALDELILLEIYPAREEPIPGITSQWLLDAGAHG
jgi:hypothetical protein